MRAALAVILLAALGGAAWLLVGDLGGEPGLDVGASDPLTGQSLGGPTLAGHGGVAGDRPGAAGPTAAGGAGEPLALGEDDARVIGRVVDEHRRPVAGAAVEIIMREGGGSTGTTDRDGRFELAATLDSLGARVWNTGYIVARHGEDKAGSTWAQMYGLSPGDELDVGTVVLREGQAVPVRVAHHGAPVAGADVVLVNGQVILQQVTTAADGRIVLPVLPTGQYTVVARGPQEGQGRGVLRVRIPAPGLEPQLLELGDERRLQVWVKDKDSGSPIAGARVVVGDDVTSLPPQGPGYLPALPDAVTDAEGYVELRGLGEGKALAVAAEAAGYPPPAGWGNINTVAAKPADRHVTLELSSWRTVRFPVRAGTVPVPEPGTPLTAESSRMSWLASETDPELKAEMERDEVAIHGLNPLWAMGKVRTEDGRVATFMSQQGQEKGQAITFVKEADLLVRTVDASGAPVPGVLLVALDASSNQMLAPAALTDAAGELRWPGVAATKVMVKRMRSRTDNWWSAPAVATIEPAKSAGRVDITLDDGPLVTLKVRCSGVARLPPEYTLQAAGQNVPVTSVEEDPGAGELRFQLGRKPDDAKETVITLGAMGYLPGEVKVPAGGFVESASFGVDLQPCGALVLQYDPPSDGEVQFELQRHGDEPGADPWKGYQPKGWGNAVPLPPSAGDDPGATKTQRYDGLESGRYRVVERSTGLESREVEVVAGAPAEELWFDLSRIVWTEGELVVPEGFEVQGSRVLRVGHDRDNVVRGSGGAYVQGRGTSGRWKLRSQDGEPLELRGWNNRLAPAAEGGVVRTRGGAKDVRLVMEAGGGLVFRIPSRIEEAERMKQHRGNRFGQHVGSVSVAVHRGAELVKQVNAGVEDGAFRVGGLAAGTYRVVIETHDKVPYELAAVTMPATGDVDLGSFELATGTTVNVSWKPDEGESVDRVYVTATAVLLDASEGTKQRSGSAMLTAPGQVKIPGLSRGRWKVTVWARAFNGFMWGGQQGLPTLERELEADGVTDLELEVQGT
ncbi:MAG: hypothetical protein AB7T63_12235 [Planctomycetota bacterium]